jgi:hypothetical protein
MLLGTSVFVQRAAARSRPVSSAEIRRAERDTRRRYGRYYYMYGSVRQGRTRRTVQVRRPGPISMLKTVPVAQKPEQGRPS